MRKSMNYLVTMALAVLLSSMLVACVVPAPVMESPSESPLESPAYIPDEPPVPESLPESAQTEAGYTLAEVEDLVYILINNERQSYGLRPLAKDSLLASLAKEHSLSMANNGFFSHDRAAGERNFKYGQTPGTIRGENISRTPQREFIPGPYLMLEQMCELIVSGWMESPGHRENILRPEFTTSGVGVSQSEEDLYITQIFEGAY